MEFLQENIIAQIAVSVVALAFILFFGIRAIKDRKAKAAKKKGPSRSTGTNRGINTKR